MQPTNLKATENTDSNFLSKMLFRYLPYWPLFLFLMLLCSGAAYAYLHYFKVPLYETKASLLIKDESKGVDDSRAMEPFKLLTTKKIVDNEIEVLRSRSLMDTVVKKLNLYVQLYEKDRFVDRSAYETSPVTVVAKNPEKLGETVTIPFSYNEENKTVLLDSKPYPLHTWIKTIYGELQFVPNSFQTGTTDLPLFITLTNPSNITQSLVGELSVAATSKLSTVINISLVGQSPQRSENILNELLEVYNQSSLEAKNAMAANTLAFIDGRLNVMGGELGQIEKKIQSFKSSRNAIDIGMQGRLFMENVSENDQKLGSINMQMAILNQVERYVTSKERSGSIVPSTLGVDDPVLTQLLELLYKAELEQERLKKTTAENNPIMLSIDDQINKIKPGILENIRNQRSSLMASKRNIVATNGSYSSVLQSIPSKERELLEISRDQATKQDIYSFLLQKREEAALSSASSVVDSRIVNKAQSSIAPVSLSDKIIYLLAIFIAIALSVMFLAFKEVMNRKILFRQEVEKLTALPIIAEIFQEPNVGPIVIEEGNNNLTAEQFRKLRTAFTFMGLDSKRKRILVTSSISGEGKSFITTNLGISVALTGKKVVIVEADMINPSLSMDMNVNSETGLSDYLRGEKEMEEIIKSTHQSPNLFVIPSGPLPINPSELIVNGRMEELLNNLNQHFDYIILDAPPIMPVSDAYVLSANCDATLYVVRHNHTPKIFIQRLDENNKINHLKNAAIVFNGIQPRGFNKNFYGYGYGYGYIFKGDQKAKRRRITA